MYIHYYKKQDMYSISSLSNFNAVWLLNWFTITKKLKILLIPKKSYY